MPSRRRRRGRAAGLIAFALAFIVVAGSAVTSLWLRYDDSVREGQRRAENLALLLSEDLQNRIRAIEDVLRELASFSRYIGGPTGAGQEWMTLLRTVAAGRDGFEAFMVTDADGRISFSSLPILMGESRADGTAFATLSANPANDALIADRPERSSNDSTLVVPLARVIRTPVSEFEGLAIANFAPEQLRRFYRVAVPGENGIIWLLSPPDNVLLRVPSTDTPRDEAWPLSLAADIAPGETSTVTGPLTRAGPDHITAYRSLAGTGLTLAVSVSTADILAPWWNELYATVALTLLVGLFLVAAALIFARAARPSEQPSQ